MKARQFSPRKLDIGAFIESGAALQGHDPVAQWPRITESLAPEADPATLPPVAWHAQGRTEAQRVGGPQLWLELGASAELALTCQRCLKPVTLPVAFERSIRFVADEAQAEALDAESDDDVLAVSRSFDLLELVEDEMIMATPLVPRHDECPEPPVMSVSDPGVDEEPSAAAPDEASPGGKPHPFAVLAQLKKKGPEQGGGGA